MKYLKPNSKIKWEVYAALKSVTHFLSSSLPPSFLAFLLVLISSTAAPFELFLADVSTLTSPVFSSVFLQSDGALAWWAETFFHNQRENLVCKRLFFDIAQEVFSQGKNSLGFGLNQFQFHLPNSVRAQTLNQHCNSWGDLLLSMPLLIPPSFSSSCRFCLAVSI